MTDDATHPRITPTSAEGALPETGRPVDRSRQSSPLPHALSQGRLHGAMAHRLGVDILRGAHRPGDILPNEIDASLSNDISRSAYREAVRILAAKGMVESRPRLGTRVTPRERWNLLDPEVLGWMFEADPAEDFILALFELRLITEPAAAALAAERRSESDLAAMSSALEIMKVESLATEVGRKADLDFHDALLRATGNEALMSLGFSIGAAVAWSTRYKQRWEALDRNPEPEHRAVFEAIAARKVGDARWAMESLIRLALKDTLRSMGRN